MVPILVMEPAARHAVVNDFIVEKQVFDMRHTV
jgi:hypothetical protein